MALAHSQEWQETEGREASMLSALDALRVAITIFDSAGRLLHANRHFNFIFPTLPLVERLIGESYEDLIRRELASGAIARQARPQGDDAFIISRVAQLAPGNYAPQDILLSDGRILEIKARRDGHGRTVLLWSDVTNARHHLGRLEEAIALSADAFAFYDRNDRFLMGNELYAQFAALNLGNIRGWPFRKVVEQVARSGRILLDLPVEEWLARRVAAHRSANTAHTLQTNDGKVYLVRDRITPDGGHAVVFTDITEKTRAETALAQTESALADSRDAAERQNSYLADLSRQLDRASAEADSAKTTLLRAMSHELKTPLNAILGFSDLMGTLADTLSATQVREYAGLVHQGGTNLLRLVNQIMDLTKLAAGRYDLRRTPVDAGGALWLARESFLSAAAAKSITVNADACPIGLFVDADEAVLSAMIANLLDNAITFIQPGGHVWLAAEQQDGFIVVTVSDNGPGVTAKDLERILRPFEQAGSVNEHAKGSGLGLTLVKAFAELHGGTLVLSSITGEGFSARLSFPALPV